MAENNQNRSWLDSTSAKVVGAAGAIAATAITARDAISRAFFKSINKNAEGAFADLQKTRDDAINAITAPAKANIAVPDAMERIKAINGEYDAAFKARRKLLNSEGIFKEMQALKRHQWMEVIFATGAVASVAVGALLAIGSGRHGAKKKAELEEQLNSNNINR